MKSSTQINSRSWFKTTTRKIPTCLCQNLTFEQNWLSTWSSKSNTSESRMKRNKVRNRVFIRSVIVVVSLLLMNLHRLLILRMMGIMGWIKLLKRSLTRKISTNLWKKQEKTISKLATSKILKNKQHSLLTYKTLYYQPIPYLLLVRLTKANCSCVKSEVLTKICAKGLKKPCEHWRIQSQPWSLTWI